jgi:rhamnosyl/mannosyltransferase
MRILQLSKYYPPALGGLELVAEFFSRAGKDLGHSVDIIALGNETKVYSGEYGEKVWQCREDVKISSSPLSLSYLSRLKEALTSTAPPDLILLHLPHPMAHEAAKWFRKELRQKKVKVVGIYHSDIVNQVLLRDVYNLHFKKHLELYDYFICSSPNLKASSAILSSLSSDKVKVIPFCVESAFAAPERNWKKFNGKFVSVGRMVPYKGYEFLVDCFKSLPYELTLIGGGPLKKELQESAPANVHFTGEVSDQEKYEIFSSHDALIMSSINRAEAYGMTIVEAFSGGLPVIASNVDTGVSFLVREGETGLKFPIKDKTQLLSQIEKYASSSELREKLSQGGRKLFDEQLSYPAFRQNFNDFLLTVVRASSKLPTEKRAGN